MGHAADFPGPAYASSSRPVTAAAFGRRFHSDIQLLRPSGRPRSSFRELFNEPHFLSCRPEHGDSGLQLIAVTYLEEVRDAEETDEIIGLLGRELVSDLAPEELLRYASLLSQFQETRRGRRGKGFPRMISCSASAPPKS